MKKIYSIIAAVAISATAFSQGFDLEVNLVTPASGSTQAASAAVPVEFTITNNGPSTLLAGDTLFVGYTKGTQAAYSLTNVAGQASGFLLQSDLAPGAALTTGSNDFDLSSFVNGDTVIVICYGTGLAALSGNDPDETDPTNNADLFFIGGTSSVAELSAEVSVYPNPAVNVLNIEANEEVESISIVALDGRVVLEAENTTSVNVSNLNTGRYIYRVRTNSGAIITDSFVKQ
jgi:hypothetical protein